jgi:hypothetical protein
MEFILTAIYFGLLCWLIASSDLFRIEGLSSTYLIGAFSLKVLAGVALWWVYAFHYSDAPRDTLDTFKYFDDSGYFHAALFNDVSDYLKLLFGWSSDSPSLIPYFEGMNNWDRSDTIIAINDNRTMIRVNALIQLLSFGHYHVHSLIFNFLGFTGLVLSFKALRRMVSIPAWVFLIAFILPPSLLFWGSGVLKETLVFFALGIFLTGFSLWWTGSDARSKWLWLLAGTLFFVSIKPYVFLAFVPGIIFLIICKQDSSKALLKFGLVHILSLLLLYVSKWHHKLDLVGILRNKRDAFVNVVRDTEAASGIEIPTLNSYVELLLGMPGALYRCLFRPTLLEADSALLLVSGIENFLYLLLLILLPFFFKWTRKNLLLILFSLSVVVVLCVIVGSVTPVLGAIVRYKVPMLPFFLLMIFLLIDLDRIKRIFPFLRSL